ncbi:MAG: hypothetical protein IKE69_01655 [Thermoguttaceae bacterium]|nr:hypothetical protein [Thermoguttaceae bacterium]
MDKISAESELVPSPFRTYSTASRPERSERPEPPEKRLIPKFPAFKRSSNKTTPFLLKRVSVSSELEKKFALPVAPPVSAADAQRPFVVSPISVRVPARPAVISPVTVSRFGELADLPKVLSPRVVEVPRTAAEIPVAPAAATVATIPPEPVVAPPIPPAAVSPEPVAAPLTPPAAVSPEPVASPLAAPAAEKIAAVGTKISLEEVNREFARTRIRAEKTRRRRFRSPLINGEIREELKDEYYWEILSDGDQTGRKSADDDPLRNLTPRRVYGTGGGFVPSNERPVEPNLLSALLVEPVVFVGHATTLALRPLRLFRKGNENGASPSGPKKRARAASGGKRNNEIQPIDFFIALVCGVAIAVVIVFPMIRKFSNGIYETVQKSNVRRISGAVSVSEESPSLLHVLMEAPEIISELNLSLAPHLGENSEPEQSKPDTALLPPQPWENEPEPFDNADWSGALLNEFESPKTEGDRGGQ